MRRLFFKKEMKAAILAGKKISTTRDHALKLEQYQAVSGSRYSAKPFAIVEIRDIMPTTWEAVITSMYRPEGFDSAQEMLDYAQKEKLVKSMVDQVFWHQFKVVKIIKEAVKR